MICQDQWCVGGSPHGEDVSSLPSKSIIVFITAWYWNVVMFGSDAWCSIFHASHYARASDRLATFAFWALGCLNKSSNRLLDLSMAFESI